MSSMDKAQRAYDNQTPEDNDPAEPDASAVEEWASGEGAQIIEEAYGSDHCGLDRVQWQEANWDKIVEWYIDEWKERGL